MCTLRCSSNLSCVKWTYNIVFSREEVQEFFNDMDRDFDEKLTFEEFMGEESHIEKVFKSMDKNGDGFVSKEEFQGVCKNLSDEQVMLLLYSWKRICYYLDACFL